MDLPTLRQLEYAVAVAEEGQFSRAARRCHVSQPALSKQVAELERTLDTQLFERVRPRVMITPAGKEIIRRARVVLAEVRALVDEAASARGEISGRIVLGVIPTIAPYLLPGVIQSLSEHHPDLEIALRELKTDELLDDLKSGRVDVGLLALPVDRAGLDGEDLCDEPFVLAAPVDHDLGDPKPASTRSLEGQSLMLMDEGHCFRDHALDLCRSTGASEQADVRATSLQTLSWMTRHGLGATLVPASAINVEFQGAGGQVNLRSFVGHIPSRRIGLRWRSNAPRSHIYHAIMVVIADHLDAINENLPENIHGPAPLLRRVPTPDNHAAMKAELSG